MPIRIATVTSFSNAQRPVSSNSSSQRESCFGISDLPSVRRVVTTSVSVGGGGLLWPGTIFSPPSTRIARGGGGVRGWGLGVYRQETLLRCLRHPPPPPTSRASFARLGPHGYAGGGEQTVRGTATATSALPFPRDRRRSATTAKTAQDRC